METTTDKKGEFDLTTFITKNKRQLTTGATVVAVAAAGVWFWVASSSLKEQRADQAYSGAERSAYSGNPQLAEKDLSLVVQRYSGTTAGARAAILLAKNYYATGKPVDGIAKLRQAVETSAAKPFRPAMYSLIAAGFENQGKFDSAATAFGQAAAASAITTDREIAEADQARALTSAGHGPEALKIWQGIASHEASPLSAEARLRIGELMAAPAKGT